MLTQYLELAKLVMKLNYFQFNEKFYEQTEGHGKRIITFLGEFVYGQLRDGAKAEKLIAKSLGTLCRRHLLRNQQTHG
jgi:hypothetical protein